MMRPPVSLARLRLRPGGDEVLHFPKAGGDVPGSPQPALRVDLLSVRGLVGRLACQPARHPGE